MDKLKINLERCFGISKFQHEFDLTKGNNTILIYAPNGTMKTSFAKTMSGIATDPPKKGFICDLLHPDALSIHEILVDDAPIESKTIFVIDAEKPDYDSTSYFSTFLASSELKSEYDSIYSELDKEKDTFLKRLKDKMRSSDCEEEFISTFRTNEKDSFFSCLLLLEKEITKAHIFYEFKYNDIFDKKGNVKKFIEKHSDSIASYFQNYTDLLSKSNFFHTKGNYTFGTYQATELQKTVQDGSFFGVDHKIILQGGDEITSTEQLTSLIESEKKKLLEDEKLKKSFEAVTKAIDVNEEVRLFKNVIQKDPTIIASIHHYEEFKKEVWLGYLTSEDLKSDVIRLIDLYKQKVEELQKILIEARKQQDIWTKILQLYKDRFYVPFKVDIANQEDIILKQNSAKLKFEYIENDGNSISKSKDEMVKILSRGELRAFYILQMLFEIEARAKQPNQTLLIFDDIADSFDYQNKYAIIEYIKDLHQHSSNKFISIILTHNFDFYRTVSSRLNLCKNVFMAAKETNGDITLKEGIYRYKSPFIIATSHASEDSYYISLIPFVRNLIEFSCGNKSPEYIALTSCMHKKKDTLMLKDSDISIILKRYTGGQEWKRTDTDTPIYDIIMKTANVIRENPNVDEVHIENKIVLSIAIRLRAEFYMYKRLIAAGKTEADLEIDINQESKWRKMYNDTFPSDEKNNILERVNMMTPENIHLNSFMYEPLIDMSIHHLIKLYNDCIELNSET